MRKKKPIKKKPSPKGLTPEKAFLKAMLAFQAEVPELPKTATAKDQNGNTYHYTPLPEMRKLLQPLLTKHGFVYSWDFKEVNNKIECSCILIHIEGHARISTMTAEKDNTMQLNNVQAVGSTMTYLQRYSFKAVLGLTSADEDNDAQSATQKREVIPEPKAIDNEAVKDFIKE